MDRTALVENDIAAGARLVDALAAAGLPIAAAMWLKLKERSVWELYVASPNVQEHGPTTAYRFVDEIARAIGSPISVNEIVLANTTNHFLNALPRHYKKWAERERKLSGAFFRTTGLLLDGTEIEEAVIYRIAPGVKASRTPLKPDSITLQKARSLAA